MDAQENVNMIDVGDKDDSHRIARAAGQITMSESTSRAIWKGELEKGNVIAVAKTAGIMGAKKTSHLLPLCHPLPISSVSVQIEKSEDPNGIEVFSEVKYSGKTGVEMEALVACSTTLLTIYDMAKGEEKGMKINEIRLIEKQGGRSGHWRREDG